MYECFDRKETAAILLAVNNYNEEITDDLSRPKHEDKKSYGMSLWRN